MPTRLRLSCRALSIIVLVRPNFYSAGPQASHQVNPATGNTHTKSVKIGHSSGDMHRTVTQADRHRETLIAILRSPTMGGVITCITTVYGWSNSASKWAVVSPFDSVQKVVVSLSRARWASDGVMLLSLYFTIWPVEIEAIMTHSKTTVRRQ